MELADIGAIGTDAPPLAEGGGSVYSLPVPVEPVHPRHMGGDAETAELSEESGVGCPFEVVWSKNRSPWNILVSLITTAYKLMLYPKEFLDAFGNDRSPRVLVIAYVILNFVAIAALIGIPSLTEGFHPGELPKDSPIILRIAEEVFSILPGDFLYVYVIRRLLPSRLHSKSRNPQEFQKSTLLRLLMTFWIVSRLCIFVDLFIFIISCALSAGFFLLAASGAQLGDDNTTVRWELVIATILLVAISVTVILGLILELKFFFSKLTIFARHGKNRKRDCLWPCIFSGLLACLAQWLYIFAFSHIVRFILRRCHLF